MGKSRMNQEDAKEIALELATEKLDSLKNHLADSLSAWMMDNMPGNIIHRICWALEGTDVKITPKSAATLKNPKVRILKARDETETIITEAQAAKMLKDALKR